VVVEEEEEGEEEEEEATRPAVLLHQVLRNQTLGLSPDFARRQMESEEEEEEEEEEEDRETGEPSSLRSESLHASGDGVL